MKYEHVKMLMIKAIDKINKYLESSGKSRLTGALNVKLKKAKEDGDIIIDEAKLEESKQYDGYFDSADA